MSANFIHIYILSFNLELIRNLIIDEFDTGKSYKTHWPKCDKNSKDGNIKTISVFRQVT